MTVRQFAVENLIENVISIRAFQQDAEFPNKNTEKHY